MTGTILGWITFAALILANALFVASEFSLTSVDRAMISKRAAAGDRRAGAVQRATRELSFQLSSAQLGITICSLLLGFVAEPVVAEALRPAARGLGLREGAAHAVAVVVALVLATLVQMLFGELVPQNLALAAPTGVSRAVVGAHTTFTMITRPVVALFDGAANAIVRGLGVEPQQELHGARTAMEFRAMIATSAEEGTLGRTTAQLLRRGLAFGEKTAADVMTPRVQVVALRSDDSIATLLELARRTGHTRFPVQRSGLDEVLGVVHVHKALGVPRDRRGSVPVGSLMTEPQRVPESLDGDALLRRLSRLGSQLAIVVDEYGGTAGVVTLEDLVEELVGQIRDEHDVGEQPEVERRTDGWELSGQLHKDDLAELLEVESPPGPFDTVGGLFMERLGRLPGVGDIVAYQQWRLRVVTMDGRRVDRVHVTRAESG